MTDPTPHPARPPEQPATQQRSSDHDAAEMPRPWRVDPARDGRGATPKPGGTPPSLMRGVLVAIIVFMIANWVFALTTSSRPADAHEDPLQPALSE